MASVQTLAAPSPNAADAGSAFRANLLHHVKSSLARTWSELTPSECLTAVSLAVRDELIERLLQTEQRYQQADAKRLYYLSMEFLMGRSLGNNLYNLGLFEQCNQELAQRGVALADLLETEPDAALGNGGLGRLAACFLDSLATLGMPGFGYGLNYEYGLFRQEIDDGSQREKPDNWKAQGTPWLIERHDEPLLIPLFGRVEHARDRTGAYNPMWLDWKVVVGVPSDMLIAGYGGKTVNYLRLYAARASSEFDMQIFNHGDYLKAVEQKMRSETISKVLYPSDAVRSGKELRLIQEYFLVACALRDIMKRYTKNHNDFAAFPAKVAIQMNDTHPSLAVAELMRMLVDEQSLTWDEAWEITEATCGYTNHTLLPEALEKWPVSLFEEILPRHLEIIYEINQRFLENVRKTWPNDDGRLRRMSLIEEGAEKQVRMAHLAMVGSHAINGVAALHTELLKSSLVPDFAELWPKRFNNKTNGVTPRRWLLKANPALASLITRSIGDGWITNLDELRRLEPFAEKTGFREEFLQIKRANKENLARLIKQTTRVVVDPDSLFDVQIKRIHEYKRQLLGVLNIIHQYLCIVEDNRELTQPRTWIFAGKAAPGYWAAKQVIKLINNVAQVVNHDLRVRDQMRVVFIPDYRVSLAEAIIPAADLSEQISTAGKEASGTGNMKLAMNGALTIGTLDGANIEIGEEVGADNIFIFGLKADEIQTMRRQHSYQPWTYYHNSPIVRRVMDTFKTDRFSPKEPGIFTWLWRALLEQGDEYFLLADLDSYVAAQEQVTATFAERDLWARKAILNVARMGKFSSDRTIREYAADIWDIETIE